MISAPVNVQLRTQIDGLQARIGQAMNAYDATRNASSLVTAFQLQAQVSAALLNATAMTTPVATMQFNRIAALR